MRCHYDRKSGELLMHSTLVKQLKRKVRDVIDAGELARVREAVDEMLACGLSIDSDLGGDIGGTALCRAVWAGDMAIIAHLLDRGADANVATEMHWFPLHYAVNGQHVEVVRLLVEHGADLDAIGGPEGSAQTPLHMAIAKPRYPGEPRKIEIVTLLLDAGADPFRERGRAQRTPFQYAVSVGRIEAIQAIVDRHNVDFEQKTAGGEGLFNLLRLNAQQVRLTLNAAKMQQSISSALESCVPERIMVNPPATRAALSPL
jgi:ankyrin repeat protein